MIIGQKAEDQSEERQKCGQAVSHPQSKFNMTILIKRKKRENEIKNGTRDNCLEDTFISLFIHHSVYFTEHTPFNI